MEAEAVAVAAKAATKKARKEKEAAKRQAGVMVRIRYSTLTRTLMDNLRHGTLRGMGLNPDP